MSRALLRSLARWVVAVLLLGQLAVAAYACPALKRVTADVVPLAAVTAGDTAVPAVPTVATDCGDSMGLADLASPNLCAEHCKSGQQSDHSASIVVPLAWPIALYDIRPLPMAEPRRRPTASTLSDLVAGSPARAILHCVRRI